MSNVYSLDIYGLKVHFCSLNQNFYRKLALVVIMQWNSTFLQFSLITEGTTEKVLQFKMPLKLIYNKILALLNRKCIFEHRREVQTIKNQLIDIIFWWKYFSVHLFRAALYRLMFVLNKDALFHWVIYCHLVTKIDIDFPLFFCHNTVQRPVS